MPGRLDRVAARRLPSGKWLKSAPSVPGYNTRLTSLRKIRQPTSQSQRCCCAGGPRPPRAQRSALSPTAAPQPLLRGASSINPLVTFAATEPAGEGAGWQHPCQCSHGRSHSISSSALRVGRFSFLSFLSLLSSGIKLLHEAPRYTSPPIVSTESWPCSSGNLRRAAALGGYGSRRH